MLCLLPLLYPAWQPAVRMTANSRSRRLPAVRMAKLPLTYEEYLRQREGRTVEALRLDQHLSIASAIAFSADTIAFLAEAIAADVRAMFAPWVSALAVVIEDSFAARPAS